MTEVAELFEDQDVDTTEQDNAEAEIQAAFDASIGAESDEDEVKLQMIGAGATFKNVTRLYNKFMIGAGLAISKSDRDQIVSDTLEGQDFESEEDFADAVASLVAAVKGTNERSAGALIRSFAKKNDQEVYKKPASEGGQRNSFVHKYYDWLVVNPSASEEEAHAFIHGEGDFEDTSENVKNYEKMHQNVRDLANRIAAK